MIYMLIDLFCGAIVPLIAELIFFVLYKERNVKKAVLVALFTLYIAELFDVVGIQFIQYFRWNPIVNFVPFGDFREAGFLFQVIANAILFIPFGFMLPLIWKRFRKFSATAAAGLLTSICIEVNQLFSFRATDIDDLLMNTLGTIIGYLIIASCSRKRWKKDETDTQGGGKRDIAQLLAVMGITLLSAIFIKGFIGSAIYGAAF